MLPSIILSSHILHIVYSWKTPHPLCAPIPRTENKYEEPHWWCGWNTSYKDEIYTFSLFNLPARNPRIKIVFALVINSCYSRARWRRKHVALDSPHVVHPLIPHYDMPCSSVWFWGSYGPGELNHHHHPIGGDMLTLAQELAIYT